MKITNDERLALYPDGACPECGAKNWAGYLRPEDRETGTYCLNCYAHFSEDPDDENFDLSTRPVRYGKSLFS